MRLFHEHLVLHAELLRDQATAWYVRTDDSIS
jgi:hypothetical protein